jgi:hypothetical protein
VTLVGISFPPSSNRERLTGAASGPNRLICWPSCESEGERPSADSGEEMALTVSLEVFRPYINYTPFVNFAGRNKSRLNEIAKPSDSILFIFIVIVQKVLKS